MFRKLVLCAAAAAILALPAAAWAGGPEPGDLFGSTGAVGGSLILIDPGTGSGAPVGSLNMFGPVSDIEFRSDGVLFGTTGGGSANLVTIDPATGAETLVGMHDLFGAVNGLEFVGSTLYGSLFAPPGPKAGEGEGDGVADTLLVTVDQTDASLTVIGTITGISPVRGLAYDTANGVMYGIGLPTLLPQAGAPEGISDVLFTVDLATGAPTVIGSTGELLGGLEFGPDGVLYAGEAAIGGPAVSDGWAGSGTGGGAVPEGGGGSALLFTIDPATAAATAVGPTGSPAISGLSFLPGGEPGPGGGSVLEIPSLSRLGLLLLAGLLAAAGLFAVRRG